MGTKVVHFEVNGSDPDGAATFYAELFGWHTQVWTEGDNRYIVVDTHAGGGINGGIGASQEGHGSSVVFYVEAADPQVVLDKAESLGGRTVMPVTEMAMITLGMFADPDGNVLGVVKTDPNQQSPGVSPGDGAPVDWFEVLGPNPKDLWTFYSQLFGWTIKESDTGDFLYGQVSDEDAGIGGGIGSTFDGKGHVNVYAKVDDLQKYLERAESLGGTTMSPPNKVDEHTSIAHLTDPQGTWFGLYTYTE